MFEAKDEIRDAVNLLVATTAAYQRGAVIPWSAIEGIAGNRTTPRGAYIIRLWRKRLLAEQRIACRTVHSVGIELLTTRDQVVRPGEDRRRRASRQLSRAKVEISAVPGEELSDHYRLIQRMQIDRLKKERSEIRRGKNLASKKSESLPMRKAIA